MKTYKILFALILMAAFSASVSAGDYAQLNYIGVSEDGKYLAFEEFGTQDGSGFPYSNIYFIDVDKNAYAAAAVRVMIKDSEVVEKEELEVALKIARDKAMKSAAAKLKQFRIVAGNNGKMVVARLLTDLDVRSSDFDETKTTRTINFASDVGSMYAPDQRQLIFKPIKIEDKKDYLELPVYKFELSLKEGDDGPEKMLQKDISLPESRGLPIEYAVQYVYLYEDKIIVFINKFTSGFEGPDMRYMVVTGRYK